jgi:hypothetical protein
MEIVMVLVTVVLESPGTLLWMLIWDWLTLSLFSSWLVMIGPVVVVVVVVVAVVVVVVVVQALACRPLACECGVEEEEDGCCEVFVVSGGGEEDKEEDVRVVDEEEDEDDPGGSGGRCWPLHLCIPSGGLQRLPSSTALGTHL